MPEVAENYVHRVGRTGRGAQRGTAISFCSTEEKTVLDEIENFITKPITVIAVGKTEYEETIDISEASEHDWKTLIKESNAFQEQPKKKRKLKKR